MEALPEEGQGSSGKITRKNPPNAFQSLNKYAAVLC